MPNRVRLLVWYRIIPLLIMALIGAISFVYVYAPAALFQLIYPLEYTDYISASSERHAVDPFLVAAVIETESNWDPDAVSSKDAHGLMQLLPATAEDMVRLGLVDATRFDPENLDDPETNIEFGSAYLSYLIDYFNGSTDRAIAAYNAGLSRVNDWSEVDTALHNAIAFPETQAYLFRVNNAWTRYKELYSNEFL